MTRIKFCKVSRISRKLMKCGISLLTAAGAAAGTVGIILLASGGGGTGAADADGFTARFSRINGNRIVYADTVTAEEYATAFVERLYNLVLGRTSDSDGLNDWVDSIISGRNTGAECAWGFFNSPEFRSKNLSDEEYVDILYRAILGREADSAGRGSWLNQLENSVTRDNVLDGFLRSTEFNNICNSYGITAGSLHLTRAVDTHPEINKFVHKVYVNLLGRRPDPAGLEDWVNRLASGSISASEFLEGVVYSNEFIGSDSSAEHFVAVLYRGILGREAGAGEIASWINTGSSRAYILHGIAESDEFSRMCAEAGVRRGNIDVNSPIERNSIAREYVMRMYNIILDREADAPALASWTSAISNGMTASEFVAQLFDSAEFRGHAYSREAYINLVHRAAFGRDATTAENESFLSLMDESMVSARYVLLQSLKSDEFRARCERFGIAPGSLSATENRDQNVEINNFVISTYVAFRGTRPSVDELNAWCGDFLTSKACGRDFIRAFCGEGRLDSLPVSTRIERLYRTALLRNPSAAELSAMSNYVAANGFDALINEVAGSQEFARRCSAAGISPVLAVGWNNSSYGRVYFNGTELLSGWQRIDGKRYYFDPTTRAAATGWTWIGGLKYYFNPADNSLVQNVDSLLGMRSSYYLTVNCTTNTIMVYAQDVPGGAYNIPVRAITCSTGMASSPTVQGTFTTRRLGRWHILMGPCWGQYVTQISGNYLFHSAWYYENGNIRSLSVREYNLLGTNASHGCVRLNVADARWIYEHCNGCTVRVFSSPESAPFDKPPTVNAVPISGDRGYDPTDPAIG